METDSRLGFSHSAEDASAQSPIKEPQDTGPVWTAEHHFFRSRITLYSPYVQPRAEKSPPQSNSWMENWNGEGSL